MDLKFIVVDEFGDSVRAFYDKESAERFVNIRPECKIEEIYNEEIPEETKLSYQDMLDMYGDPPF